MPTNTKADCARPGCHRGVKTPAKYRTCSLLCKQVLGEIEAVENVTAAAGEDERIERWRAAVAELSDALTSVWSLEYELVKLAREAGLSSRDWGRLKQRGAQGLAGAAG